MKTPDSHTEDFATRVGAVLNQAQANSQIRQQLARARQHALQAPATRSHVLTWVHDHRPQAGLLSVAVLLALLLFWQAGPARAPLSSNPDITAQVVDEVLYDSLEGY
ncbi:hypothetical protein HZU75_05135 [Chitinibacter fontanus]|uniref:DUF3619 family protein n=1 Tax=Chitinibacter fontanus TaxID=1737446 RepID=A0A7D5V8T9_9NEIS|nr:hypothetical protein [Chitinibacter fontanus]QLI80956.1 hypothetical protein HZU75_05135 [Chitinibacter fontanus]